MIRPDGIGDNPCLSAKKAALKAAFLHPERRDENPGRVRYRAALCEAENPCLLQISFIIKHLQSHTQYYTQKWQ